MISVDEARKAIKNGELLVYPTDTLWGIGCDPFNETAVKKLFEIKGKRENGLSIILNNNNSIEDYCILNALAKRIIREFLPGPITLILESKKKFAKGVTKKGTIGIRIPANKTALDLALDSPIITTSANKHGLENATSLEDAKKKFGSECLYISGEEPAGIESTIIDLTKKQPKIKRIGALYSSILEGIIEL